MAKEFKDFLKMGDGQEIFTWGMRQNKPKGALVIVHGLGEHSGRYRPLVQYLSKKGWNLYLYDQRGHGKTPGLRSFANDLQEFVDDCHEVLTWVRSQEKSLKPFILGHSFGGQVVINYLAQYPKEVRAAILSSPNIQLAMQVPWLKRVLGRWISLVLPSLSIPNDIKPQWISHDPKVVREYEADPLVNRKITLRLGAEILENLEKVPQMAPSIKVPVFLFHGSEDRVTSPEGTEKFYDEITVKDRQLKIYPGFFHETLNERGREKVYQDLGQWLEERA